MTNTTETLRSAAREARANAPREIRRFVYDDRNYFSRSQLKQEARRCRTLSASELPLLAIQLPYNPDVNGTLVLTGSALHSASPLLGYFYLDAISVDDIDTIGCRDSTLLVNGKHFAFLGHLDPWFGSSTHADSIGTGIAEVIVNALSPLKKVKQQTCPATEFLSLPALSPVDVDAYVQQQPDVHLICCYSADNDSTAKQIALEVHNLRTYAKHVAVSRLDIGESRSPKWAYAAKKHALGVFFKGKHAKTFYDLRLELRGPSGETVIAPYLTPTFKLVDSLLDQLAEDSDDKIRGVRKREQFALEKNALVDLYLDQFSRVVGSAVLVGAVLGIGLSSYKSQGEWFKDDWLVYALAGSGVGLILASPKIVSIIWGLLKTLRVRRDESDTKPTNPESKND